MNLLLFRFSIESRLIQISFNRQRLFFYYYQHEQFFRHWLTNNAICLSIFFSFLFCRVAFLTILIVWSMLVVDIDTSFGFH